MPDSITMIIDGKPVTRIIRKSKPEDPNPPKPPNPNKGWRGSAILKGFTSPNRTFLESRGWRYIGSEPYYGRCHAYNAQWTHFYTKEPPGPMHRLSASKVFTTTRAMDFEAERDLEL